MFVKHSKYVKCYLYIKYYKSWWEIYIGTLNEELDNSKLQNSDANWFIISIKEKSMPSQQQNADCPLMTLCLTFKEKSPHPSFYHHHATSSLLHWSSQHICTSHDKLDWGTDPAERERCHWSPATYIETIAWQHIILMPRILSPCKPRDAIDSSNTSTLSASASCTLKPYTHRSVKVPPHIHTSFHREPPSTCWQHWQTQS